MDNNKIISMIDEYLTEPHSISREWVEALTICRQALIDNKKKDTEIDILIRKKEALRDEIAEQKAEIERFSVKEKTLKAIINHYERQLKTSKSEARKEFAERLKEKTKQDVEKYGSCTGYGTIENIDNLLKEMEGEE